MSDKLTALPVATLAPVDDAATVGQLMQLAIQSGISVEGLEKLVTLSERVADRLAAQEFARAFAEFQRRCPPIPKTSIAKITTDSGGSFSYRYAKLDEIARTANPILSELGFSYGWDSEETDSSVKATCTLRHSAGHSVSASAVAPIQARSKATSAAQNGAIARTFAMRNSLVQVLGITSADPDVDGAAPRSNEAISATQAADLECLIEEVKADRAKFLAWLQVGTVEEIRAADYERAVEQLQRKGRQVKR